MECKIEWINGSMVIKLDGFFPVYNYKLKKLKKVIDMDYAHRDDIIKTLYNYVNDRITSTTDERIKKKLESNLKIIETWKNNCSSGNKCMFEV